MSNDNLIFVRPLVKLILEQATSFAWELKGLGLMRTYLSDDLKLHVWDKQSQIDNVSMTHEHPWSFESLIVAGCLKQYRLQRYSHWVLGSEPFESSIVQCGPGGRLLTDVDLCHLHRGQLETYHEGQGYKQDSREIHQSLPEDGTVTLVRRISYQPARAARVYWPANEEWVSSEPIMATPEKIRRIADNTLRTWFGEGIYERSKS